MTWYDRPIKYPLKVENITCDFHYKNGNVVKGVELTPKELHGKIERESANLLKVEVLSKYYNKDENIYDNASYTVYP